LPPKLTPLPHEQRDERQKRQTAGQSVAAAGAVYLVASVGVKVSVAVVFPTLTPLTATETVPPLAAAVLTVL